MSRRGVILAIIVFICLGLYVFFVERGKPLPGGKELIFNFKKDEVKRLILKNREKEIVLEKEKDKKWQIISPLFTKADDGVVDEMVKDLSSLEARQSLEVDPSEWRDFGLREPENEVTILIGDRSEKVSFGDKNPAGTSVYTRVRGRDKIYLVSTYLANSFKKEVYDLREKRVLLFDKEKVSGIEILYEGIDILVEKRGDQWQVLKPVKDKGDKYEIDGLVSDLHDLKAVGFIDKIEKGKSYGLDKPGVKCIVWIGPEKTAQTLICGNTFKEGDKELQYVQRELLSTIFKVEGSKVNALKKSVFELRNKIIFTVDRDKVQRIELVYPDRKLILERGEEDKWSIEGKEDIELDEGKVSDILWDLTDIRAEDILSEEIKDASLYGLDTPEVKAVVKVNGEEKIISFGKEAGEKEDTVYSQVAGDQRLFLVSDDLVSRLKKGLSDLKKKEEKDSKSD